MSVALISNLAIPNKKKIPIIKNGIIQSGWSYQTVPYTESYSTNPNITTTQGDGYLEFKITLNNTWQSTGTAGLTTSQTIRAGDTLVVDFDAESNNLDSRYNWFGYFAQINKFNGTFTDYAKGVNINGPGSVSRMTYNVVLANDSKYFAAPVFYVCGASSGSRYAQVRIYNMYLVRADES